jgi:precorrin-6B methylase 1
VTDQEARVGSLSVVGAGIRTAAHLTAEAIERIGHADVVLFLGSDPAIEAVLRTHNQNLESLAGVYCPGGNRGDAIRELAERIVAPVRLGLTTCAALYGHPGVFCVAGHNAVQTARNEGFIARMLPGISAEACLFAELGVDPSTAGCQSFEAMQLLIRNNRIDPHCHLILWQIGVMGDPLFKPQYDLSALPLLVERLAADYSADHVVTVYSASQEEAAIPSVRHTPLGQLSASMLSSASTLYVPPLAPADPDPEVVSQLRDIGFPVDLYLQSFDHFQ